MGRSLRRSSSFAVAPNANEKAVLYLFNLQIPFRVSLTKFTTSTQGSRQLSAQELARTRVTVQFAGGSSCDLPLPGEAL